jgi:hypothetical protein
MSVASMIKGGVSSSYQKKLNQLSQGMDKFNPTLRIDEASENEKKKKRETIPKNPLQMVEPTQYEEGENSMFMEL